MKFKLYFVEDETVIRENIRNSIDWSSTDFEYLGDAPDAETALTEIMDMKPDILVTDIRMDGMSGLELCRQVSKLLPDTSIIILSGYDDFEYARTAVSLNVVEYLLKPVTPVKLIQVLNKTALAIDKKRSRDQEYQDYISERINEDFSELHSREYLDRDMFREYLENGQENEADAFIERFLGKIGSGEKSMIYVLHVLSFTEVFIKEFFERLGIDEKTPLVNVHIDPSHRDYDLRKNLKELLVEAINLRNLVRSDVYEDYTRMIKDAIEKRYADGDFSLSVLAKEMAVSAAYLSTIYKKRYGETFSQSLTNVRMQKARELLRRTTLQVTQISEAVGYADSNYFSVAFKKRMGMTPREYRKMQSNI